MPSFQQSQFIEASIQSVLAQDYEHVELIVIDGGSTDGTVELLKKVSAQDKRLRFISEPDQGPADALNKALKLVRGTIIGWLNSDDLYLQGAIKRAVVEFESNKQWLMIYGHAQHINERGEIINTYPTKRPEVGLQAFNQGCYICQPTVFFKYIMPILLGGFNVQLKTAFDFDYWLRAFSAFPEKIGFLEAMQAQSRLHSNCITLRQRSLVMQEGMSLLAQNFGKAPKEWALTYINELMIEEHDVQQLVLLHERIDDFLSEVKCFLTEEDFSSINDQLNFSDHEGYSELSVLRRSK